MPVSAVPEWDRVLHVLAESDVSEVAANGPGQFFAKRAGRREKIEVSTASASAEGYTEGISRGLVPLVASPRGFDPLGHLFEGRISFEAHGSKVVGRCHVVTPPACDSPQVTITKKAVSLATLEAIAACGSMSTEMMRFLEAAVSSSLTVAVSGMTGAGKTTMMEALTKLFRQEDRIGVAEDIPELALVQPNVTYLHSTPWQPGMDSNDVATLSWVVQQFQRMRTDKVIVGEVRGREFADFLVAANSGMEGSMITIHANSPVECLSKMTNFALRGSERQPVRSVNTDIANSVNIIVQLVIDGGRHRVSHIQEVVPTLGSTEEARISTAPLYLWDRSEDRFYKAGNMSDRLRQRMTDHGADVQGLLASEVERRFPAHSTGRPVPPPPAAAAGQAPAAFGLPVAPGARRSL